MSYVQLSRDPLGRRTFVRRLADEYTYQTCSWCGCTRGKRLFQYGWDNDGGGQPYFGSQAFCSVGCYRSYQDEEGP